MTPEPRTANARRIGLVGCVKEKAATARLAQDLYTATLFLGRRRYVEATCEEWEIFSAEHGMVHRGQLLAPYDVTPKSASRPARRRWTEWVLAAIDELVEPHSGDVFEIHAGSENRNFGLIDGLRSRGCRIEVPTEGLPIGRQLQFYKRARRS